MTALQTYLAEMTACRSTGAGVPETSYYGFLGNLLTAVGATLKPKVYCVINLANRGAGIPDGGLFTSDQLQKGQGKPVAGAIPSRGVIEVKGTNDDSFVTARGKQVTKYWKHYGLVLVTNYRDFVLVGKDEQGEPVQLETYSLAVDEAAFWRMAGHPAGDAAKAQENRFADFLQRVMLQSAALERPADLAWFLASYARDALGRIEGRKLLAMDALRAALEESLGLKFEGRTPKEAEKREHFFRSTLVQTLFYGVFSAWVLWHNENPGRKDRFEWKQAAYQLQVPIIRTLFYQLADPAKLASTGLVEPLEWAAAALNRVHRGVFFSSFDRGLAVQYFYEPFLEHFDPELRKEMGVWYTPREIVKYMVARVDTVLREELGRPDGLADKDVVILDPCCGTGAYLVEVIEKIAETMKAKGNWDAGSAEELKKAVTERIFGFEILPAPFVVAHLQLGLLLQNLGSPLSHEDNERAGVYLTNSLTGWEPPEGAKQHLMYPEMEQERDAADIVKQKKPILVIIGNPPYNAFAGISPEEEAGLVEPYKEKLNLPVDKGGWGIKKFNMDELYVRFFRIAEKRIGEHTGQGVVCFISNTSWVTEPSFVVLRKHLFETFDKFWIENLHGNRKISEYAPDGKTSETIFAVQGFSPGIQQGVATSLWVKTGKVKQPPVVLYRNDLQEAKAADRRQQLLKSLTVPSFDKKYEIASPSPNNRYSFRPAKVSKAYAGWPKIIDLCVTEPLNGPIERRGNTLIVYPTDVSALAQLRAYLDATQTDEAVAAVSPRWMHSSGEFDAPKCRLKLKGKLSYNPHKVTVYPFKPFDIRRAYLDAAIQPLFSRPAPELLNHAKIKNNRFFLTRDTADKSPEGPPFLISPYICDYDCISGHARHFPVWVFDSHHGADGEGLLSFGGREGPEVVANLAPTARKYLTQMGMADPDNKPEQAELLWLHALAIGYAPMYLDENAEAIKDNWPRIPLPAEGKALEHSAELGRQVAALLDSQSPVKGVTASPMREELRLIGSLQKTGGGSINPAKNDLEVTAGWGHAGKKGVTMPGWGKVVRREYDEEETRALRDGAAKLGITLQEALDLLGHQTCDVYLNGGVYWCNIPANVYGFVIGGYQVIKKWLSYREKELLGRGITMEEAREVQATARRLGAILLLHPKLDENYAAVQAMAYDWAAARE